MVSDNREKILEVKHLKMYFKKGREDFKAVDDVNFHVFRGEVLGIVGESGCGKTTVGRTIIKLYNATDGEVYFKGRRIVAGTRSIKEDLKAAKKAGNSEEVRRLSEELKKAKHDQKYCDEDYMKETGEKNPLITKIQMIFQDPIASLNPRMTVREIISEGLTIRGIKDKEYIQNKVYEVLDLVGLVPEHADRYPHEFSGGQRQRIGIARAIVLEPELMIADEPVSALDVSIQAQVINLLNDLRLKMNLTIMFVAHDLSVVKYFSDRIAVMYFGKIVEVATSDELFKYPMHPYTQALLSAIPIPDPHVEKARERTIYKPSEVHDYSVDKPSMREIYDGHYVLCNDAEEAKYKQELSINNAE